jgi:hypothetical protein
MLFQKKYLDFLNLELSPSLVDPFFLVSFMENLFENNVLPRGWELDPSCKSFIKMNNG